MSKRTILHIQLRPSVKEAIARRAREENRTMTNWIETLVMRMEKEDRTAANKDAA